MRDEENKALWGMEIATKYSNKCLDARITMSLSWDIFSKKYRSGLLMGSRHYPGLRSDSKVSQKQPTFPFRLVRCMGQYFDNSPSKWHRCLHTVLLSWLPARPARESRNSWTDTSGAGSSRHHRVQTRARSKHRTRKCRWALSSKPQFNLCVEWVIIRVDL